MKNNVLSWMYALPVFFCLTALGCNSDKDCATADKASCAAPLNPNGDSELALLMREMADSTARLRERILKGEAGGTFPASYEKLLSAHATQPEKVKSPAFATFGQDWLNHAHAVYEGNPDSLRENYMLLVNSCKNCHQAFCPGPLVRIRKLEL